MFRVLCIVILITCLLPIAQTQSPYQFGAGRESALFGGSIGLLTYSRIKFKKLEPLTIEQLENLRLEDILAIDRGATTNNSIAARKASDILLQSSFAVPFTLLLGQASRDDFVKGGLLTVQTLLVNAALTDLTKVLAKRNRPFVYNEFTSINQKLSKKARTSFFSGHASTVASMYFLSAKMYSDYYPNSSWKPAVWSAAIILPATTALLRVKAGKHYFTDVLTGFLVGATVGYLIPELHRIAN